MKSVKTSPAANVKTVVAEPAAPLGERFITGAADAGYVTVGALPVVAEASLAFGQAGIIGYQNNAARYNTVRANKLAELRARRVS